MPLIKKSLAFALAAGALAVAAPAAQAACPVDGAAPVLAGFGDASSYLPVAGGDFESGATGWTLVNGARIVDGDATPLVGAADDARSLELPPGGAAISPPVCVTSDYPFARMLGVTTDGAWRKAKSLDVTVLYGPLAIPAKKPQQLHEQDEWSLTPELAIDRKLLPKDGNASTVVRFAIAANEDSWRIDDLHVDPRMW
jgi:hypothetical protein